MRYAKQLEDTLRLANECASELMKMSKNMEIYGIEPNPKHVDALMDSIMKLYALEVTIDEQALQVPLTGDFGPWIPVGAGGSSNY